MYGAIMEKLLEIGNALMYFLSGNFIDIGISYVITFSWKCLP